MGSLGDKFKKLAGDQTRQLLQNFQNAQSSKTKNGYSYGKLNEDGTATLADGTVVQVEVKGRPGQYAPVFNLGNGQGLVDQPEAKFFTVDGNPDNPYVLVVGWTNVNTDTENSITLKNIWIVDRLGGMYQLPPEFWPPAVQSMPYGSGAGFYVTCCAGFGGFSILVYCGDYILYTKSNIDGPSPLFPNASYLTVNSFTLDNGFIELSEGSYSRGSFDYNPFLEVATTQYEISTAGELSISGSSECYQPGESVSTTLNDYLSLPYGSATYSTRLKLLMRGSSEGTVVTDLSVLGTSSFRRGISYLGVNYFNTASDIFQSTTYSRQGVYSVETAPPNSESLYAVEFLYTNFERVTSGGTLSGIDFDDPSAGMAVSVFTEGRCHSRTPYGPSDFATGGRTYSKVVENWQATSTISYIDSLDYNPLSGSPAKMPRVVAAIATKDINNFKSIISNQQYLYNSNFTVSLNEGYTLTELYSTTILPYLPNSGIERYPVGYNNGIIVYGEGGLPSGDFALTTPIFGNKKGLSYTYTSESSSQAGGTVTSYLESDEYFLGALPQTFKFLNLSLDGTNYTIVKTYDTEVDIASLFPVREQTIDRYTYAFGVR